MDTKTEKAGQHPRIVSLSTTATSMLALRLGASHLLVGVDSFSAKLIGELLPKSAVGTLSGWAPKMDELMRLRPDVVVCAYEVTRKALLSNGTPPFEVVFLSCPVGDPEAVWDAAMAQLQELAVVVGMQTSDKYAQILLHVPQRRGQLKKEAAVCASAKTYFVEMDPKLYSASSRTPVGCALAPLQLHNLADEAVVGSNEYPQFTPSQLVNAKPGVLFVAHKDPRAEYMDPCTTIAHIEPTKANVWDPVSMLELGTMAVESVAANYPRRSFAHVIISRSARAAALFSFLAAVFHKLPEGAKPRRKRRF
eukprot:CAMPEP_0114231242 /NCGR_PEP_ID=MMETSP0058-20121206/3929_1 /TAXON_ID=36894 /ORGANISM="Pyramimonas parkeae, CCMP726" /LENGTH=307 /DNA_ID=CAMNT_0001342557 /DNA_START=253 /DNA_END=1176 /DNA_ORIENTATION=+